jgi:2-polyprenyl-3-methyl-5-hydroxy-6-metoxy-1,4-benzoquinol methylase
MTKAFDSFSKNYNEDLNDAIRLTGYDSSALTKAKLQKLQELFPDLARLNFNLLDFGCGIGNLFESVKQFFPCASYTGVDQSGESIIKAQSRFSASSIFHNLNSENWKNTKYDLIFSAGVFHHIPHDEHKKILKELSDLLNPNGKLVIWEHNPFNPITRKIVNDCVFDQDAVLIYPSRMKKNMLEIPLANIKVIYTTFFPKIFSSLNVLDPYLGWLPLGGQFITYGEKI